MLRNSLICAFALCLVACAGLQETTSGQAILDFATPPNTLYPARLVSVDGEPTNAPLSKTSFWVDPGLREIVVSAGITDPTQVRLRPDRSRSPDQGRTTIEVEAGKRYRIAAQLIDKTGAWEPVIWKIEDAGAK
jgi:hypothetical protein